MSFGYPRAARGITSPIAVLLTLALAAGILSYAARPGEATTMEKNTMMTSRPVYSRADLPALKIIDRQQVFTALGSFDGQGLTEDDFARRALALLDPARVPGLAEALAADDLERALAAVHAACVRPRDGARPELTAATRKAADEVLGNRFTFYGEAHQLPQQIDWNANPGTAHWTHDLNRFTYLGPLTQAYRATGDTRYSRKAVELILDWITKCDFADSFKIRPYAFGSYLNLAIHAGRWSSTVSELVTHDQVTPRELIRILKSLHDHLAYLEIVTNGHAGNWPTIGFMGMLGTLEYFPIFRDTERFIAYCRQLAAVQIAEQVLPDGAQDELTTGYHQVVINNLVNARRSLRALGTDLDPQTLETMRKMVHYRQQTIVPDGSKQVAFNDGDPRGVPNLARLLAPVGMADCLTPPDKLGPECFPYAGVALLRQRQDQGDLYLAFDAGPFGRGHQHEDKLGFWLFAYGRSFLVDPGRHLYDTNAAVSYWAYLCSTRAHSTILVDGEEQNSRRHRDTWIAKEPLDLGWRVAPEEVRASGVYDLGYGPANEVQVVHRREIVFARERCWVVFDQLTGDGWRRVESRFQFAPGDVRLDGARAVTGYPDANLLLWPIATLPIDEARIEKGQENPRSGWYSDSYKKIEPSPTLSLSTQGPLPLRIATLLFPYRGTELPAVEFTFDGETAVVRHPELGEVRVESTLWERTQ